MPEIETRTNPRAFRNPHTLSNRVYRLAWQFVQFLLTATPPRAGWPIRKIFLRAFGAEIGSSWIHSTARIWSPSNLKVGDDSFIDRKVFLYNPWRIKIGSRTIISFESLICTPSHDFRKQSYPLIGEPIQIGEDVWIASRSIVGPGVHVQNGCVLGAACVLFKDAEPWTVYAGNPARPVGKRELDK